MPALAPGGRFGPYVVESRLGAGGMGVVYVATDTRLDRRVALKVVTGALVDDPEFQVRFRREAATLARADSPHIVSIFEHGEHESSPFIATQLVAGGDLGSLLADRGPLSMADTRAIGRQISEALSDAHGVGVIHRDVKPANVLIRDRNVDPPFVYLCDFGIARTDAESLTQTGAVAGSFAYIAPERLSGESGTPASDIYGLGCVLWTCLTGEPPYSGSVFELARAHATEPVPQLPGTEDETQHMNWLLERCLAKRPEDRFASAAETVGALSDIGGRGRTTAPPPAPGADADPPGADTRAAPLPVAVGAPPPETSPVSAGGRMARNVAIAVLAVLLFGGGGVLAWRLGADDDPGPGPTTTPTTSDPARGGTDAPDRCADDERDASDVRGRDSIEVDVVNATGVLDGGAPTIEQLASLGYAPVDAGGLGSVPDETVVQYRPGFCAEAVRLTEDLALADPTIEASTLLDLKPVRVVLGSDAAPVVARPTPEEIEQTLRDAAAAFPTESVATVTARSWSVDPSNIDPATGEPRNLAGDERATATEWEVIREDIGARFTITAVHIPPDADDVFGSLSCDQFPPDQYRCQELTTSDGTFAYEYWYLIDDDPSSLLAGHQVVIPSDSAAGTPMVEVTEELADPGPRITLDTLSDHVTLTGDELLRIAETPDLLIPLPDPPPSLPSFDGCESSETTPPDCP